MSSYYTLEIYKIIFYIANINYCKLFFNKVKSKIKFTKYQPLKETSDAARPYQIF